MNRFIALLAVLGLFAFTSTAAHAAHQTTPVGPSTVSSMLDAPISAVHASASDLLANNCYRGGYNRGYYRPYNYGYRGGFNTGFGYGVPYGGGFYGRPAFGYPGVGYGRGINRGGFGLYIGF